MRDRLVLQRHLGTPVLQTDAAANVVWRVEREPYGTTYILRTGADRHQPLSFPGQEEGWGWRATSRTTCSGGTGAGGGRYTQSDPIELEDGLNVYSYVGGNPLSKIDPEGLTPAKITSNCPCANCPTGNRYQFGGTLSGMYKCWPKELYQVVPPDTDKSTQIHKAVKEILDKLNDATCCVGKDRA